MMNEKLTTLARPYAQAAFDYALNNHDVTLWETMLQAASLITQNKRMQNLINNPEVNKKQLEEIYLGLLENNLDQEKKNFIRLLIEYGRLEVLPEIKNLFSFYRAQYEKKVTVQVTSAIPLGALHQQKFIDALTRRLQRKVTLECAVDPSLLGGAIVRAGDLVIDGSVRGKLNRMLEFI